MAFYREVMEGIGKAVDAVGVLVIVAGGPRDRPLHYWTTRGGR